MRNDGTTGAPQTFAQFIQELIFEAERVITAAERIVEGSP